MLSSVCDPYQPAESRYRLTQGCLMALREFGWDEAPTDDYARRTSARLHALFGVHIFSRARGRIEAV